MAAYGGALRGGARLSTLLHNFGLPPSELAGFRDHKAIVSRVRAVYLRRAKEMHPDLAPEERKAEAAASFVALQKDFQEAVQLLESGVTVAGAAAASARYPPGGTTAEGRVRWAASPHAAGVRKAWERQQAPPESFDIVTRVKGHLVFWSGLFIFLCGFREFLVLSAGSTAAWYTPSDLNPFWVRRFQDEWVDQRKEHMAEATTRQEAVKAKARERQKELNKAKRDKEGSDSFYKKRSNSKPKRRVAA